MYYTTIFVNIAYAHHHCILMTSYCLQRCYIQELDSTKIVIFQQLQRQSILRGTIYIGKPCEVAYLPNHISGASKACSYYLQKSGTSTTRPV